MKARGRSLVLLLPLAVVLGCRQEMSHQPAYRPLVASEFFADQRSARPLEPGTRPLGQPSVEASRMAGRKGDFKTSGDPARFRPENFVSEIPVPVTPELLERGQERFNIYCAVCHDRLGTGDGKIPQRGFTRPPSFLTDNSRGFKLRGITIPLRQVPVGYVYEVISNGFGAMPDYASQIPVHDRWAIVAYEKALILSQPPTAEQPRKPGAAASRPEGEK